MRRPPWCEGRAIVLCTITRTWNANRQDSLRVRSGDAETLRRSPRSLPRGARILPLQSWRVCKPQVSAMQPYRSDERTTCSPDMATKVTSTWCRLPEHRDLGRARRMPPCSEPPLMPVKPWYSLRRRSTLMCSVLSMFKLVPVFPQSPRPPLRPSGTRRCARTDLAVLVATTLTPEGFRWKNELMPSLLELLRCPARLEDLVRHQLPMSHTCHGGHGRSHSSAVTPSHSHCPQPTHRSLAGILESNRMRLGRICGSEFSGTVRIPRCQVVPSS